MHPITVKKQVNDDDGGVCLSLDIYCLVHGKDYRTIPPAKFNNRAHLFMIYTVMGFQFDQDDNYDPVFDEDRGNVTHQTLSNHNYVIWCIPMMTMMARLRIWRRKTQ
jgi:hypothetical protein